VASVFQYAKVMRDAQWDIALKLGVDISQADRQTRAVQISGLAVVGALLELLTLKGIVTDLELLQIINSVRNDPFVPPKEPIEPVEWDTTPVTGF